jgi:hypothetical protein
MQALCGWWVLLLGAIPSGCLIDNTDKADAGTENTGGSTVSNLCTSQISPCGGDVSGSWAVKSICAVGNPADKVNANFTTYPSCVGVCTAATVTASGSKTYDSGTLTSSEAFVLSETLSLTSACFLQVMGTDLNESTCQAAAGQFASATCALSTLGCTCQITESVQNSALSYAVSGNVLTEAQAGSLQGTSLEYCVLGNTMTQRRTLPPGVDFMVTYTRR